MDKYWIALFAAVLISSLSQMFLKAGSKQKHKDLIHEYLNRYVVFGYFLMIISTLCVIIAYRGIEYKNGPVIESLGYLFVMLFSRFIFHEKITLQKLFGNLLILAGVTVFYL